MTRVAMFFCAPSVCSALTAGSRRVEFGLDVHKSWRDCSADRRWRLMSRWKRLSSARLLATTLVLFAGSVGTTGCEVLSQVDRSQIPGELGGGGGIGGTGNNGGGGQGGTACVPVD